MKDTDQVSRFHKNSDPVKNGPPRLSFHSCFSLKSILIQVEDTVLYLDPDPLSKRVGTKIQDGKGERIHLDQDPKH